MKDVKQVLVVRRDLNMRKGKIAAQAAHASMKVILDLMKTMNVTLSEPEPCGSIPVRQELVLLSDPPVPVTEGRRYQTRLLNYELGSPLDQWLNGSFTKICVSVNSEAELDAIYEAADDAGLPCSLIIDEGRTEFQGKATKTAVAVGPAFADQIDPITGHLPPL